MANDREIRRVIKEFGLILRKIREDRGWTLEDCEEHGWKSWQHLQKIEAGKKDFSFSTLLRLRKLYGLSFVDLFKKVDN